MTEDELGNVHLLFGVNFNGNSPAIVVDGDGPCLNVDVHFQGVHGRVVDLGGDV